MQRLRNGFLAVMVMLGAWQAWTLASDMLENSGARAAQTWQVEMRVSADDLPGVVSQLDSECKVEIESQGVSFYVVAYSCP